MNRPVVLLAAAAWGLATASGAIAAPIECASVASRVKAQVNTGVHGTNVAFNSNPGRFHPVPLLSTNITVGGTVASCLIAHFSAMAQPQDNWVVFQVRVDGVPMFGHAAGLGGVVLPVVFDPDESGAIGPYRMVAHDFFARVAPGPHRVEVYFAGCCSANPNGSGAAVESPVITLQYR
jgi:hypothetical protein